MVEVRSCIVGIVHAILKSGNVDVSGVGRLWSSSHAWSSALGLDLIYTRFSSLQSSDIKEGGSSLSGESIVLVLSTGAVFEGAHRKGIIRITESIRANPSRCGNLGTTTFSLAAVCSGISSVEHLTLCALETEDITSSDTFSALESAGIGDSLSCVVQSS